MGSFSQPCEIVEASVEADLVQHNNVKSSRSKSKTSDTNLGYKDFLKNDINKLFATIDLKQSKSVDFSHFFTTGPVRKSPLNMAVATGVSRSPGTETIETMNLKQALRELSLTKASEMAAMKRLSKLATSSRASEAGRITTLYNSVVIEASHSSSPFNDTKKSVFRKPLEVEQSTSKSKQNFEGVQVPVVKLSSKSVHSYPQTACTTTQRDTEMTHERNYGVAGSMKVRAQTIKLTQKEKHSSTPSCPGSNVYIGEENKSIHSSSKAVTKESPLKPVHKVRLQTAPSSNLVKGNRVGKSSRNTARPIKPSIRNKGISKKKVKEDTTGAKYTSSTYDEVNGDAAFNTRQLICERCQCTLNNAGNESKNSLAPQSTSGAANVILNNGKSAVSKSDVTYDGYNSSKAGVGKVEKHIRVQDKVEFSQSSKSSRGEYSSSTTSISDESHVSGSSCGNRPHMSKDARWEAIRRVHSQKGVLSLTHFNLLKKLGCGDIGTVYLAELVSTNCLFAIKVIDNEFLSRRQKLPRAQTEREILRMLDHPFLPTLFAHFTSDNFSCLVMEYCPGGDLHVLRQKQPGRIFPEEAARFYVAEVLLALEYLHMLGVVYRDLKPENILVREDGHIMVTDFDLSLRCSVSPTLVKSSSFHSDPARASGLGTESSDVEPLCITQPCQVPCFIPRFLPSSAKSRKLKADLATRARTLPQLIAEPTDARSNSFVGTHEYLSPEIIKGDGHGAAVDWWTFGVFLYELLYGRTPFKGCNNEETLANVVLQSLRFPESPLVSFQARELIRRLLVKDPDNRLGTKKGAAEIKKHPFFEGLNWALIRCAIPPELPKFCDVAFMNMASQQNKGKLSECKATIEHLEFELF